MKLTYKLLNKYFKFSDVLFELHLNLFVNKYFLIYFFIGREK